MATFTCAMCELDGVVTPLASEFETMCEHCYGVFTPPLCLVSPSSDTLSIVPGMPGIDCRGSRTGSR